MEEHYECLAEGKDDPRPAFLAELKQDIGKFLDQMLGLVATLMAPAAAVAAIKALWAVGKPGDSM